MNNKGFLRIIEATFAVILIITVMFVFFTQSRPQINVDYSERARDILQELSRDPELRNAVLNNEISEVDEFVRSKIPEASLEYEIKICDIENACGKSVYTEGNVYSGERIISSTLTDNDSSKVRLFIWEKQA